MKNLILMSLILNISNAVSCDAITGEYVKCGPGAEVTISTSQVEGKTVLTMADDFQSQSLTEGMNVLNDADTELICNDEGAIVNMYAGNQVVATLSYTVNEQGETVYNNSFMGQSMPEMICIKK